MALEVLSRRILALTGVNAVEVLDEHGERYLVVRRPQPANTATLTVLTRDLIYASPEALRRPVGKVRINFDGAVVTRDAWSSMSFEFGLVMFTMLAMLAMLVLWAAPYQRLIRPPLEHLLRAIHAPEAGNRFVPVELQRSDEMAEILTACNSMQRHLAAHTQRLPQVYNQTPALLFSTDANGRVVSASDYLCGYLGHAREVLVGGEMLGLAPSTDAEIGMELRQAFHDGRPVRAVPLTVQRGDGSAIRCCSIPSRTLGAHSASMRASSARARALASRRSAVPRLRTMCVWLAG